MNDLDHTATQIDVLVASFAHGMKAGGYAESLKQCWREDATIEPGSQAELHLSRSVNALYSVAHDLALSVSALIAKTDKPEAA